MSNAPTIVWFRQDLRLNDNPALHYAVERGAPVIPVFVWSPEEDGAWPPGAASRWWLHHSLLSLDRDLRKLHSRIVLRAGPSLNTLESLIDQSGATAVYWNRRYEPAAIARDAELKLALRRRDIVAESFNSALLFEPWMIKTQDNRPYRVFTPFSKACFAADAPALPLATPPRLPAPRTWPASIDLKSLALEPTIDWAAGIRAAWIPGTTGAAVELDRFLDGPIVVYSDGRDAPAENNTSRLSPHLHWGEISPRRVWHQTQTLLRKSTHEPLRAGGAQFLKELLWREFGHHLLFHFPQTANEPLRPEFANFPWAEDRAALHAWQHGRTGYPLVDAGMRQLWRTGWMHNRVRMVVASFLVKHLLLPWQLGARWFWDTLVNADLANNTLGWQWSAGCGADAAPYFRIFNPALQGERFDPHGDYVRRWLPELSHLNAAQIQRPHDTRRGRRRKGAPAPSAEAPDYPKPIVDHAFARKRALAAFATIGRTGSK